MPKAIFKQLTYNVRIIASTLLADNYVFTNEWVKFENNVAVQVHCLSLI